MAIRPPSRQLIGYHLERLFRRLLEGLFSVEIVGAAPPACEGAWVVAELRSTNARLVQELAKPVRDSQLVDDLLSRKRCLEAYTPPTPVVPGGGP